MSQSPPPSANNQLSVTFKHRERSEDQDHHVSTKEETSLPPGCSLPRGEYASGLIVCDVCGTMVSFRNEVTREFTLSYWNHHRETCILPSPSNIMTTPMVVDSIIYTPESTALSLAHPRTPAKRRRPKRSEAERIAYLRADPYVAKFDAYRVLCASCDKWIRLRPNSTYCSIPWEAHRKGCLMRRPNVCTHQERDRLFTNDPGIHKFDTKGILCAICESWIAVHPDQHAEAADKWLQHRSTCQNDKGVNVTRAGDEDKTPDPQSLANSQPFEPPSCTTNNPTAPSSKPIPPAPNPHSRTPQRSSLPFPFILCNPDPGPTPSSYPSSLNPPSSNPPSIDPPTLNPTLSIFPIVNYGTLRRTAEQRAASLRADRLIAAVEPHRVFCSVCRKWVQLRQDSSYCSHPWVQHRGKCLTRTQRRAERHKEPLKAKGHHYEFGLSGGAGAGYNTAEHGHGHGRRTITTRLSTNEDRTGSERCSHDAVNDKYRRSSSHLEASTRANSSDQDYVQRSHYPQYHYLDNYQRVERQDRNREDDRQHRCQPQAQPQRQRHVPQEDIDVKPVFLLSRDHPNSYHRESTVQTEHGWDARSHSSTSTPEVHSSSSARTSPYHNGTPTRRMANLVSPSGRKIFIHTSITYLFSTTFDSAADSLSVPALVAYLNAALPPDRWEDFDEMEVRRALELGEGEGEVV